MASTYKPSQALDKIKKYLKSMPVDQVEDRILDEANKQLWMAAPWRWTLGGLPDVDLVAGTRDYPIALPADFLFAYDAYLTDQDDQNRVLTIEPLLPATGFPGMPSRIAVTGDAGGTGQVRVTPIPASVTAPAPKIISLYKKISPIIKNKNMSTDGILELPDEWFWIYEEAVLYQAYKWGNDGRAGSVQVAGGNVQFSGQRAEYEAGILFMKSQEKLPEIEPITAPETRKPRG